MKKPFSSSPSLLPLVDEVVALGDDALQQSSKGDLVFHMKEDHTAHCEIDGHIETRLGLFIEKHFSKIQVIGEEKNLRSLSKDGYSFVIDPIDGTTSYCLGLPGWCISIGLLLCGEPVAGIVYCPVEKKLFFRDLDGPSLLNGKLLQSASGPSDAPPDANAILFSFGHLNRNLDTRAFPGKVLNFGSMAYHICLAASVPGCFGAICNRSSMWDIAGAHAIASGTGLGLQYLSGKSVDYFELSQIGKSEEFILVGMPQRVSALRLLLKNLVQR